MPHMIPFADKVIKFNHSFVRLAVELATESEDEICDHIGDGDYYTMFYMSNARFTSPVLRRVESRFYRYTPVLSNLDRRSATSNMVLCVEGQLHAHLHPSLWTRPRKGNNHGDDFDGLHPGGGT